MLVTFARWILDILYWVGSMGTMAGAVDEGMLGVAGTITSSEDDSGPWLCIAEGLYENTGMKVGDVKGT
jgi:hypothetical protein